MRERPILFSGPMVQALLADRKTQTRRVVKGCPFWTHLHVKPVGDPLLQFVDERGRWVELPAKEDGFTYSSGVLTNEGRLVHCPYGQPGDRLWVREAFAYVPRLAGCDVEAPAGDALDGYGVRFRATWDKAHHARWKPSIHMPRWASRITLEITEVRVQRLQDISEDDAVAEGFRRIVGEGTGLGAGLKWWGYGYHDLVSRDEQGRETYHAPKGSSEICCCHEGQARRLTPARCAYRVLWESINGIGSWDANPWVWAVSFKRVEQEGRAA